MPLDLKLGKESAEIHIAIRRGATVKERVVGPENRPVNDVLMLSRHILGADEDTFRNGKIIITDGQFALHGLDFDASVPVYFLDPKMHSARRLIFRGSRARTGRSSCI